MDEALIVAAGSLLAEPWLRLRVGSKRSNNDPEKGSNCDSSPWKSANVASQDVLPKLGLPFVGWDAERLGGWGKGVVAEASAMAFCKSASPTLMLLRFTCFDTGV